MTALVDSDCEAARDMLPRLERLSRAGRTLCFIADGRPALPLSAFAAGVEDGDDALGALLVVGVGRVGGDGAVPPESPLVAL